MLPTIERKWLKTGANDNNNESSGKPQTMAIGVVEFSREGYKIRKVFA